MGLWRLLGGEVNWERVARMNERGRATEIHGAIINSQAGGIPNKIPLSIDRLTDDEKNNVKWVLEKFGRQVPDLKRYPFLSKSYLDPQMHLKQKHNINNQPKWDKAWEWYDAYKSGAIPFLEYRIQIRETEMEEYEDDLRFHKAQVEKFGKNRAQIWLIKYYEKKIPEKQVKINELKRELESLKAKEIQPDLSLENENLRLKKEILEMKLKLKEANIER